MILQDYILAREEKKILRLTILPTLKCNFRCKYCWESLNGDDMSEETANAIIKFVEKNINKYKLVDLNWFGGEPLLKIDIMSKLGSEIKKLCDLNKVYFTSGIVTNGFLLSRYNIKQLKAINVNSYVITLDGPRKIHNSRRYLQNGSSTFNEIIKNMEGLINEKCYINLGVNCDLQNINYIEYLLKELDKYKKSLIIYFRWVFPDADKWGNYFDKNENIFRSAKDSEEILKVNWLATNMGFKIRNPLLVKRQTYCNSEYKNHYIIDPNGNLYKCNVEFELKKSIGHITSEGEMDIDIFIFDITDYIREA